MGESYRGLTIRFGAEDASLQKYIQAATSAARSAQTQLTRLNRAMKLDPANIQLTAERCAALSQRADVASTKLKQLRQAEKSMQGTEVAKLAASTHDAALKAAQANEQYNRVDATLEQIKTRMNEIAGKDIFKEQDQAKAIADFRKLGDEADRLADKLTEMKAKWHSAFDELQTAKQVARFRDLQVEIQTTGAELKALNMQLADERAAAYSRALCSGMEQARASMQKANAQADALDAELRNLDAALRLDPSGANAAAAKFENLQAQVQVCNEKCILLRQQMDALKASGVDAAGQSMRQLTANAQRARDEFGAVTEQLSAAKGALSAATSEASRLAAQGKEGTAAYRQVEQRVSRCTARVRELQAAESAAGKANAAAAAAVEYRQLETQLTSTSAQMRSLNEQMASGAQRVGTAFSTMKSLGMTAYATLTPAALMFGYKVVASADEIDAAYRSMRKTVQGTNDEFEQMLAAAKQYASTNFTSADTILGIEAMGGQLGIATDKLNEFSVAVSNIDIATDIDADTASQDLGQLSNILTDLTQDKFGAFSDALVRLGNNNATLESGIIDVTSRIGSMGSIIGMSTPQLLAWATAIASTGQNSEAAGTAVSNTMSDIETAVSKGGSKLQAFADVAGMTADEFASKWRSDPSAAMQAFVNGLHQVTLAGGSADGTLQDLGITGVRQKQALLGLAQTTDTLSNALTMSQDAWDGVSDAWGSAGDAANEASQKSEGFSGSLQILKNNADNAASEFGDGLTPVMDAASSALAGVTGVLNGMPAPLKTAAAGVGVLAAGFGPFATIVSSVGTHIDDLNNKARKSNETWAANARAVSSAMGPHVTLGTVVRAAAASTDVLTMAEQANAVAAKASGIAAEAAAAKQMVLNAAMKVAPYAGLITAATAVAAATIAIGAAAADAADKSNQLTVASRDQQSAVQQATAAWEQAKAANGENSAEALKAKAALEQEKYAFDSAKETIGELNDRLKESVSSHNELISKLSESQSKADLQAGSMMNLADQVAQLSAQEGKSADDKAKLSALVDQLNTSCEGLNASYDDQADKLNMSAAAMQQYVEAAAREQQSKTALENYNSVLEDQMNLQQELAEAQENLQAVTESSARTQSRYSLAAQGSSGAAKDLRDRIKELESAIDSDSQAMQKYMSQVTENTKRQSALSSAVNAAKEAVSQGKDSHEAAAEAAARYSDGLQQAITAEEVEAQTAVQAAQEQANLTEELQKSAEKLDEYAAKNPFFCQAMTEGGYTADTLAQKLQSAGISADDFTKGMDDMASKVQNAFQQIEGQSTVSIDQMIANLQHNIEVTSSWADNLQILYARAGDGAGTSLVNAIAAMGPEYASTVQGLVDSDDAQWSELVSKWQQGGQTSVDAYLTTVRGSTGEFATAGGETTSAFADGMESKQGEAESSGKQVAEAAGKQMDESKGLSKEYGRASGSSFAAGVNEKTGEASAAGAAVSNAAANSMDAYVDWAWQWGAHMGSNFAAGLWSKVGEASSAASAVAAAAAANLEHTIAKEGPLHNGGKGEKPWGEHMVDNYIAGINAKLPDLRKASALAASAAASALSARAGSMSLNMSGAKPVEQRIVVQVDYSKAPSQQVNNYTVKNVSLTEGTSEADAVKAVVNYAKRSGLAYAGRR